MALFVITVLVFGLVMGAMAVGVIAGRSPIKGSCGGMGALGVDTACELCGGNHSVARKKLVAVIPVSENRTSTIRLTNNIGQPT